jgi:hypothetical protein
MQLLPKTFSRAANRHFHLGCQFRKKCNCIFCPCERKNVGAITTRKVQRAAKQMQPGQNFPYSNVALTLIASAAKNCTRRAFQLANNNIVSPVCIYAVAPAKDGRRAGYHRCEGVLWGLVRRRLNNN